MHDAALVYVVDDDDAVRRALSRLLGSVGLAVQTFSSARAFLDHRRADRTACFVLDVRLPGLSGLDLRSRSTTSIFSMRSMGPSVAAVRRGPNGRRKQ